jgi:hypothetical protein
MKTVKMLTISVLALGLMAWQVEVSEAAPMGTAFTYQGRLLDANDTADGEYDFQFKLYDAPNGGVQQGSTIDINDVDVIDGYFTAELDFGSDVFDGNDRWLQIGVRQVANPFTILSPRQEVTPTPYALYAASGPGVPVPLELSGSVVFSGAVIKGINTGTGYGVYGKHDSSGNFGYLGHSDRGVYGYSINDYGVRGHGGSYGVYGSSSDGYGVYGKHYNGNYGLLGSSEHGVYGEHSTSDNYGFLGSYHHGVYGKHNSSGNYGYLGTDNFGVAGYSIANKGVAGFSDYSNGIYGQSISGTGVCGKATAKGDGENYGGYFTAACDRGYGVYGNATATGDVENYGGYFTAAGDKGYGVYGKATGINGYAGYFAGDVYVENNVSAESFTDRTPYPKDLATAYQAVMSMERLPDGQYDENNKQVQLDHSKLSDFIKSKDGNRDLSATVSCHNEVLKHLIRKNDELEKAYIHIEQLHKRIDVLEDKLVKLQAGLNIVQ